MTVVVGEREQVEEPASFVPIAHLGHPHDPTNRTALCLVEILGVPAVEPFERCESCEFLAWVWEQTDDLPVLPERAS